MITTHYRSLVVSACLWCLAPWLALAQPVITVQPVSKFLTPGQSAFFTVGGTPFPLNFQWLFNGVPIPGATHSFLNVINPQPTNWGYYSAILYNASGSVTSQLVELKVFATAPHSLSGIQAQAGGPASLTFAGETTPLFAPYYDLYPLETSSDLVNWAPLITLQRSNTAVNTLTFQDTNASQFSQRFYRTPTNSLLTPDPQPTGPYPVGTFSMLLTNTNRNNAQFMVTFWYPAVAQAGVLPVEYVDPEVAFPPASEEYDYYNFGNLSGGNFDSQAAAFYSHSPSNAPLATNYPTYPVVLYQPGAGGHRRENTDKTEELASWGYVVVGLDTSDTSVSVFPNGTVVTTQGIGPGIAGLDLAIEGRLLDMQFVLDELAILNANDPLLGGRLNLNQVGVFGWSLGGSTAAQLCLRDPRCKAGAGLDGPFWETNLLTQPLNVPYLYFRSDLGPDPAPGVFYGFYDNCFAVYNAQVTNAYWVKLASTIHGNFSDYDLIVDSATLAAGWGTPMSGQFLPPGRASQIVRSYLLSFFNKVLKGEDDHLLDGLSPVYPEVMQFLSTTSAAVPPEYPSAGLVQGTDGNFYGTTAYGGKNGYGTIFQVTTNGTLTTLLSFNGSNGGHPAAALVQDSDGNFYGTTEYGGTNGNNGTGFQMTPAGALTTLVSFNGTNGSYPIAGLVQGSDGNFYGTTLAGGTNSNGTIFKMTAAGTLTTLVSFSEYVNGSAPFVCLVQGTNGSFYGTTELGNGNGNGSDVGTVFSLTPGGAFRTLFSFTKGDGENPAGGLVEGTNGNFYGTTTYGGNLNLNAGFGFGTVFQMTPSGSLTTLISFTGANGSYCVTGLVQGSDGNLYGTTAGGGAGGGGTVFKMTYSGALTTLALFNGSNGIAPSGLVQGNDGNFYGTTEYGGANGRGTVFQVTTNGTLTTLVSF